MANLIFPKENLERVYKDSVMRLDTARSTLPHYTVNQTSCLHQKVHLLPSLIQQKPSKLLALFQFLVLELNSRGNTTGGPAVLCFMANNSFAALICEVNSLLCEGAVALCFTMFLVSENLACSHHLLQASDQNITDHLTVPCTLQKCPKEYALCDCRTWLSS